MFSDAVCDPRVISGKGGGCGVGCTSYLLLIGFANLQLPTSGQKLHNNKKCDNVDCVFMIGMFFVTIFNPHKVIIVCTGGRLCTVTTGTESGLRSSYDLSFMLILGRISKCVKD